MDHLQKRLIPRLVLDSVNCIELAYSDLDHDQRTDARYSIASLLQMDVTDTDSAVTALRTVARHLRDVEARLDNAGRPFAMRKVRSVRQRVEHATLI